MTPRIGTGSSLVGGAIAAIMASVCCVGPLLLVALGIGGAWVAQLTRFEAVRPLFIGLTVVFLGLAYRRLYHAPQLCVPGTPCADPRVLKRQRALFWIVGILLLALIAFPWVAPMFIE